MSKVYLFMMVSIDGYFEGPDHDLSWHNVDSEFNEFAISQLEETDCILLGRKTYQLFEGFWPTALKNPATAKDDLIVARHLEETEKIVFSRTLEHVGWKNTKLVKYDAYGFVSGLKKRRGKDIAIFGSNNLCVELMRAGLVDEFRLMVNPVAIGKGTRLFSGIVEKVELRLKKIRKFASGNVLLFYTPSQNQPAIQ